MSLQGKQTSVQTSIYIQYKNTSKLLQAVWLSCENYTTASSSKQLNSFCHRLNKGLTIANYIIAT